MKKRNPNPSIFNIRKTLWDTKGVLRIENPFREGYIAELKEKYGLPSTGYTEWPKEASRELKYIPKEYFEEFIQIAPFYRHKRGVKRLRRLLPLFDIKVKQIIDTEGIIPFRQLWYTNRTPEVKDFLNEYMFCLAFRKKGGSIWRRINLVGIEEDWMSIPKRRLDISTESLGYYEKIKITSRSKQYKKYEYEKWEYISHNLLELHKLQVEKHIKRLMKSYE
tara:strand:+ start:1360 stop:2022 length:663 start_codon:yes stop_codon:yes gene_type:complete